MEKLLDYIMYALLGHDYEVRYCGRTVLERHTWHVVFEGRVYITLDEHDKAVIRFIADNLVEDPESIYRYNHLLEQLTINE